MAGIEDKFKSFDAITNEDQILIRILKEVAAFAAAVPVPPGGLATESTLVSVLNAIVAADQDIEILLVRDTGDSDKVLQQITDYTTGVPTVTYKDVDGNVVVPVGPLEYLDPSAVLNLILTQNTALNNKIITDTDDGAVATDQVLPLNMSILYAEGDGAEVRLKTDYSVDNRLLVSTLVTGTLPLPTGAATEVTLAALEAKLNTLGQKASAASAPVVLSTEQEAILAGIDTVLDTIKTDTAALVVDAAAIEALIITIDGVLDAIKVDTGLMATDLAAIEVLLTTIDSVLDNILLDTTAILADTALIEGYLAPTVRTYNTVIATGAGSVPIGAIVGSVFNQGGVAGTWNGVAIAPGETIPIPLGHQGDTYGAIAYDGTGTSLLIQFTS